MPESVRHMADFIIKKESHEIYVDIKTSNLTKEFSMANLSSIKQLFDLLNKKNREFLLLICSYHIKDDRIEVSNIDFIPINNVDIKYITLEISDGVKFK